MIEVRRLGQQIGAEITGVDVKALDDKTFASIYRAWLDHNVIAMRDQDLTLAEFVDYSRRFGSLELHPSKITRNPDAPEVTMLGVNKFDAEGKLNMAIYRRGAEGWHTDGSYEKETGDNHYAAVEKRFPAAGLIQRPHDFLIDPADDCRGRLGFPRRRGSRPVSSSLRPQAARRCLWYRRG